jgi:hypothetical protein
MNIPKSVKTNSQKPSQIAETQDRTKNSTS